MCPALPNTRFNTVIFDCDSTLSRIEGIEELASAHRQEVARLTESAMRGEVPLEDVYGRRLALVRPTRMQVEALGARYFQTLVPDAAGVVATLRGAGIDVRIISAGLRPAVVALAHALGVPETAVAAVDVVFDVRGEYMGFDTGSPLVRSGGKRVALERWIPPLERPAMLVGDGATDLEARPAVDCFVAFTGVVERPAVAAAADVVITSPSLAPVLPLALGAPPLDVDSHALYDKGRSLLVHAHDASAAVPWRPE